MAEVINLDEAFSGDPRKLEAYVKATENLNIAIESLIKIVSSGDAELTKIKEAFEASNKVSSDQIKQINKLLKDFPKLKKAYDDFEDTQKGLNKTKKAFLDLTRAEQKVLVENQQKATEIRKEIREDIKSRKIQSGSLNELRKQLKDAREEFDNLNITTKEGRAESKKMAKDIKALSKEVSELEESTGRMQRNVGNYTDSIKQALGQTGAFGGALVGVADKSKGAIGGLKGMITGVKTLGGALKLLGIGLLISAFTVLSTILTKTQGGVDFVEQVFARLTATFNVLIDRTKIIAQAFSALFDGEFARAGDLIAKSVSGITDEIIEESKAAADLTADLQKLRKQEIALIETRQRLISQFERTQVLRDDETKSLEERQALNEKALQIARELRDEELKTQRERVRILEEQAALRGGESQLLEQEVRELAEARARIFEIEDEFISREAQLVSDRNSFVRELKRKEINSELALERAGIEERLRDVRKGSEEELELKERQLDLEFEQLKRFNEIENTEDSLTKEQLLLEEQKYLTAKKELRDAYRQSEKTAEQEFNEALDAELDALIEKEKELVGVTEKKKTATDASNKALEDSIASTLLAVEAEDDLKNTVLSNVRDFLKAKLAEFIANQLAKAQIGPPVSLFALPLIGAGLSALFNKLIPAFEKGTNFSPEGVALVGEKGFEFAEKNGKLSAVGLGGAEFTHLERGTKIYPHEKSLSILESISKSNDISSLLDATASQNNMLLKQHQSNMISINERNMFNAVKSAIKSQPKQITNIDENGFSRHLHKNGNRIKLLNKKNSF